MKCQEILFIVGPTAAGKTEVAFRLAKVLGAEIISCDAMQVYRQVDIASSKPPRAMRDDVRHHLLDVLSVEEDFDVAAFAGLAEQALNDIRGRGKIPVVVGGSGLYVQVLLDGIFPGPEKDEGLRQELLERFDREGAAALHAQLAAVDATAAARIHPNDARRVIRALEVYLTTRRPISSLQPERQGWWGRYDIRIFGLERERSGLYDRVNARVEEMFAEGLVEEVRRLRGQTLSRTAGRMIGLREVGGYLDGQYDLEQAKALMKLNTRRYAKRQLTWFRKEKRIKWIPMAAETDYDKVVKKILKEVGNQKLEI